MASTNQASSSSSHDGKLGPSTVTVTTPRRAPCINFTGVTFTLSPAATKRSFKTPIGSIPIVPIVRCTMLPVRPPKRYATWAITSSNVGSAIGISRAASARIQAFLLNLDFVELLHPRGDFFGGQTETVCYYHKVKRSKGEQIRYIDVCSLCP